MGNKYLDDLPAEADPGASDVLAIDDGSTTSKITPTDLVGKQFDSNKTTDYTVTTSDQGKRLRFNGTDLTVTIPNDATENLPTGWSCFVKNINSTDLTVGLGAGVTLTGPGTSLAQYARAVVTKTGANAWDLDGGATA